MDMALSEHEFYAPKRFTISPYLTITKVRFWGPNAVQNVENSKIVSQISLFFLMVFGSVGGSDDMKIAENFMK